MFVWNMTAGTFIKKPCKIMNISRPLNILYSTAVTGCCVFLVYYILIFGSVSTEQTFSNDDGIILSAYILGDYIF